MHSEQMLDFKVKEEKFKKLLRKQIFFSFNTCTFGTAYSKFCM